MDKIKVGDAVISDTGTICVVVRVYEDFVTYVISHDNFTSPHKQTIPNWLDDLTMGYKPIIITEAQKALYGF